MPSFSPDGIEQQASENRTDGGHGAIIRHALGVLDCKTNDQDVVDLGRGQEGGIKQCDNQKAPSSQAGESEKRLMDLKGNSFQELPS